jgi:hypothetical protein
MTAIYRRWKQYRISGGRGKVKLRNPSEEFFKKIKKIIGQLKKY